VFDILNLENFIFFNCLKLGIFIILEIGYFGNFWFVDRSTRSCERSCTILLWIKYIFIYIRV